MVYDASGAEMYSMDLVFCFFTPADPILRKKIRPSYNNVGRRIEYHRMQGEFIVALIIYYNKMHRMETMMKKSETLGKHFSGFG